MTIGMDVKPNAFVVCRSSRRQCGDQGCGAFIHLGGGVKVRMKTQQSNGKNRNYLQNIKGPQSPGNIHSAWRFTARGVSS